MKASKFIEKRMKDILEMKVIGYITYPSTVLGYIRAIYDPDEEYNGPKFSVQAHHAGGLFEQVRTTYNTLFQRVLEMSGRHLINDNKSTIVLWDDQKKKVWYFHVHDFAYHLTDGKVRQGWDYEFDPMNRAQDQENWFSSKNLWF